MKRENIEKIWQGVKKKKAMKYATLKKNYLKYHAELLKLLKEKKELESEGVEFGTPSWKMYVSRTDGEPGRYLRLLYPNGKRRYIGNKEDKIAETLAAIERGKRHIIVVNEIRSCGYEIEEVIDDIKAL